jgi:hypothetical protein
MFAKLKILAIATIAGIGVLCSQAVGSEERPDDTESRPEASESDLGLTIYGLSLHTDWSKGYNAINPGLGLRYVLWRPAPRWTAFGEAGFYYDSNREWAKYVALGGGYRFAGSWSVGAAVAYGQSPSYNGGKPFFAVVPGVAFEYRRVTFNAVLLPSQDDGGVKIEGLGFSVTVPLDRRD